MSIPLVLGGGPAGCAAAIMLARGGSSPLLLERSREDADALCGGFLSWRSRERLDRLGVRLGTGAPVGRMRLFAGRRVVEADLPAPAIGVSRRLLDAALRDAAARAGVRIERGVAARRWQDGALHLADGAAMTPDTLFLATGKHELRGLARPVAAGDDPMLGVRVRLAAGPAIDRLVGDAIELHLFDGGYAGLVRQEDGANLCLAVRRSRLTAAGGVEALLAGIGGGTPLGERLAWRTGGSADAVANVPYGWRATTTDAPVWRLGDQAAVITSLAGEGMGIALASGIDAADAWLAGQTAPAWQGGLARRTRLPLAIAGAAGDVAMRTATAPLLLMAARLPGAAALVARVTRLPRLSGEAATPFTQSQASRI